MSIEAVRFTPEHHMAFSCHCGWPVSLPSFGQAAVTCRCGMRYSYDCDTLRVVRPQEQREGEAP